ARKRSGIAHLLGARLAGSRHPDHPGSAGKGAVEGGGSRPDIQRLSDRTLDLRGRVEGCEEVDRADPGLIPAGRRRLFMTGHSSGDPQSEVLEAGSLDNRARYQLLTSLVVPRPIGWVSSQSTEGVPNLA